MSGQGVRPETDKDAQKVEADILGEHELDGEFESTTEIGGLKGKGLTKEA